MLKRTYEAVLHLRSSDDATGVSQLAGRVYTSLIANSAIYKTPDPAMPAFKIEIDKLDGTIKVRNGDSQKIQACIDQSRVVYDMLKGLTAYVDKVAKGDRATILLSGFDNNDDAENHGIPDKPVIKRIEDDDTPCSAKIFMDAVLYADRYKVEITYTPADATSWKTILDPVAIGRMKLKSLTRAKDVYIRVVAGNTHGWGTPSEAVMFLPR